MSSETQIGKFIRASERPELLSHDTNFKMTVVLIVAILFLLSEPSETSNLPPPVRWVTPPDDPSIELLEPSFSPLYRSSQATDWTHTGWQYYSYCFGNFGSSAGMLSVPTNDRFDFLVNWMQTYSIPRLRLAYRRLLDTRLFYYPTTSSSFGWNRVSETRDLDAAAASHWASGYPKRQHNLSLDYSTYISAADGYKIVDDLGEFGEWDVVMLCERPKNGDHSVHDYLDARPTRPGWIRLSNRIQEAKLISTHIPFEYDIEARCYDGCDFPDAYTPTSVWLFDLAYIRHLAMTVWGVATLHMAEGSHPISKGFGNWLPGQPTPQQLEYYDNATYGNYERTVLEVGSTPAAAGMRFGRSNPSDPLWSAALVCIRLVSACAPDDIPPLLAPGADLKLRLQAINITSTMAETTTIAGVTRVEECATICHKHASNASSLCGGISFCPSGQCRIHHRDIRVNKKVTDQPGCELYELL